MLDDCIKRVIRKSCKVNENENITTIRHHCDLPDVGVLIERRRLQFMNNLLDISHYHVFLCTVLTCKLPTVMVTRVLF